MRFGSYYHSFLGLLAWIRNEFCEIQGRLYDSWNGIETSGQVSLTELDIPDPYKAHAVKYQPVKIVVFLDAMSSLPIRNWGDFAFVDYGCGKGRALLLATRFDFGRIVGIDLSAKLTSIARRNSDRFVGGRHKPQIDIQTCSSVDAELPSRPSVYFFYNPFDEQVMSETLRCIDELLVEIDCDAYALYINPRYKDVFPAYGFRLISSGMKCSDEWMVWHRPARKEINETSSLRQKQLLPREKHSRIYLELQHLCRLAAAIAAFSLHCNTAYF
jgi:SAM-dependent methyltransferase